MVSSSRSQLLPAQVRPHHQLGQLQITGSSAWAHQTGALLGGVQTAYGVIQLQPGRLAAALHKALH